MKLIELTPLLSTHNRFQSHWNESGTVKPVPSFKSVSPSLKPLIGREINTYIEKFHSFRSPPLDAVRLATGQARYRRMGNRLGPLQLKVNPGSGALAGRSTWSQDAARHDPSQRTPSCDKESGLYGLTPTDSRQVFCIVPKMLFRVRPPCWALCVREGQGENNE